MVTELLGGEEVMANKQLKDPHMPCVPFPLSSAALASPFCGKPQATSLQSAEEILKRCPAVAGTGFRVQGSGWGAMVAVPPATDSMGEEERSCRLRAYQSLGQHRRTRGNGPVSCPHTCLWFFLCPTRGRPHHTPHLRLTLNLL